MSHTTVETETVEPIGFLDGRPVYEDGEGKLVAGPSGTPATAGADGAHSSQSTETDQSSDASGRDPGSAPAANASTSSAEGSTQASNVDASSTDAGSGQQAQGDLTNLRKALAAERALRKQGEKELKELRLQNATQTERDIQAAKDAASVEAEARVRQPLLKNLAAAELRAAGVQGSTSRLVGLLDLSKVEIDDDGDISGLSDQVETLRTEFPNLFQVPSNGRQPAPNANGGAGHRTGRQGDNGAPAQPKKWHEILAEQVLTAGQGTPGVSTR